MQEELQEHKTIKEYILGIAPEGVMESVEERLMTDDEYFEEIQAVEEELIQSYVDGKLTGAEKAAFEERVLLSPENRDRVTFARAFRKYLNDQKIPLIIDETEKKSWFAGWFAPVFRWPVAVGGALAVVIASFFVWSFYTRPDDGQILALFNDAYKTGRPVKSRISKLDYASFDTLRSNEKKDVNTLALERVEDKIKERAGEDPTANNLMLLGRLYLTKKEFDKAIEQLEKAQKLDPRNAEILNDLGVAYLEKGLEKGQEPTEGGVALQLSSRALEKFGAALAIDQGFLEARFNRARCLEALDQPNEAKKAWEEYLQYDSTSGWADDARRYLRELSTQSAKELKDDELQQIVLTAVKGQDEEKVFQTVSQNRELIKKKYLPQKLAMSLVKAEGESKAEFLQGMRYLGEVEKKINNDHFASDLAEFYSRASKEKFELLKDAEKLTAEGYDLLLSEDDFTQAEQKFSQAAALFLRAGNDIEANTVCKHFIAYCLYNTMRKKEAYELLKQVDEFTRQRNYKWFSLMNLYWFIFSRDSLGYISTTETIGHHEQALKAAQDMGDLYMTQKFLVTLVSKSFFLKQEKTTFTYLAKLVEVSSWPNLSVRQKLRNLDEGVNVLARSGFPSASKALVNESISLQESPEGPIFAIGSQKDGAIVYTETGDYQEAEKLLTDARRKAESLIEKSRRDTELGEISLLFGNLESRQKDHSRAVKYYGECVDFLEGSDNTLTLYNAKKSRLLAYQALGDNEQVEKDLAATLKLTEDYREKITDEQDRNKFFSYEQEVYDAAVEHEFRRGRAEQAFNYNETSNSRSLLDLMKKKSQAFEPAGTLPLNEIRERMPANVQILEYSVLKDKVLTWIVTKEKVSVVSTPFGVEELTGKIKGYLSLIRAHDSRQSEQLDQGSKEFYRLLIEPALPYLEKEREICIIPNKILFQLPFASLLSPAEKYFLEDFSFFYSPSANIFVLSTEDARKRNTSLNEALLSVGNPAFDQHKLPSLDDLRESAKEAGEIARNYQKPKLLLNENATKERFRQALKTADVLHFAGHYIVNPERPLASELVMAKSSDNDADNFFTNYELKDEELPRTKLVILSACQTGVEGYYNGEGLIGLSRTFLSLGVPVIVASQWSVESGSTAVLMKKFHKYRKQDKQSTVYALRKAQLEILGSSDGAFRSPFYWAAFAAFGGYAEF